MSILDLTSILVSLFYPLIVFSSYLIFTTYGLGERLDILKVFESIGIVIFIVVTVMIPDFYITIISYGLVIMYILYKVKNRSKR